MPSDSLWVPCIGGNTRKRTKDNVPLHFVLPFGWAMQVQWETEGGHRATSLHVASWITPPTDCHTQQYWHYMSHAVGISVTTTDPTWGTLTWELLPSIHYTRPLNLQPAALSSASKDSATPCLWPLVLWPWLSLHQGWPTFPDSGAVLLLWGRCQGELRADQSHRGFNGCTDAKGFATLNPLYMKVSSPQGVLSLPLSRLPSLSPSLMPFLSLSLSWSLLLSLSLSLLPGKRSRQTRRHSTPAGLLFVKSLCSTLRTAVGDLLDNMVTATAASLSLLKLHARYERRQELHVRLKCN